MFGRFLAKGSSFNMPNSGRRVTVGSCRVLAKFWRLSVPAGREICMPSQAAQALNLSSRTDLY